MASLVVTGASPDAWLTNYGSATYADAREGTAPTLTADAASVLYVGQSNNAGPFFYETSEAVIQFDTSSLPNGARAKSAVLQMWGNTNSSDTDFEVRVRAYDFGGTIEAADFVAGSRLEDSPTLATFNTTGMTLGAYNTFTPVGGRLARSINPTGYSRYLLYSDRHAAGTTPPGYEYVGFEQENAAGTSNDPKLTITYTVDMVVEVSLSNLSGDIDEECGVTFRLADTSNFLAAYVDDGDNLVHLSKFVAGVETSLVTAAWTPADTAEIRVICQDNRIRVWVNRKLVINTTDSTFDGNERAGLFSRNTTVVRFANFYAEAL